jgi:hypothetical protein
LAQNLIRRNDDNGRKKISMCRSIKILRQPDRFATEQEINEAALQYVRKVSGYRKPSKANQAAFDKAVAEVAEATKKVLEKLTTKQPA